MSPPGLGVDLHVAEAMRQPSPFRPQEEWGRDMEFAASVAELGLARTGIVHIYQTRHGGASHDAASRHRPIEEIQKRGRWRCLRSVARYENGGRINQVLNRLSTKELEQGRKALEVLPRLLANGGRLQHRACT